MTINPNRNPFQTFNFLWILIFQTQLMNVDGLTGIQPVELPLIERLQFIRWRHTHQMVDTWKFQTQMIQDNSIKWL